MFVSEKRIFPDNSHQLMYSIDEFKIISCYQRKTMNNDMDITQTVF